MLISSVDYYSQGTWHRAETLKDGYKALFGVPTRTPVDLRRGVHLDYPPPCRTLRRSVGLALCRVSPEDIHPDYLPQGPCMKVLWVSNPSFEALWFDGIPRPTSRQEDTLAIPPLLREDHPAYTHPQTALWTQGSHGTPFVSYGYADWGWGLHLLRWHK